MSFDSPEVDGAARTGRSVHDRGRSRVGDIEDHGVVHGEPGDVDRARAGGGETRAAADRHVAARIGDVEAVDVDHVESDAALENALDGNGVTALRREATGRARSGASSRRRPRTCPLRRSSRSPGLGDGARWSSPRRRERPRSPSCRIRNRSRSPKARTSRSDRPEELAINDDQYQKSESGSVEARVAAKVSSSRCAVSS